MAIEEDLDAYLEDFGDPVSVPDVGITDAMGILSQAEKEVLGGIATAPDYVMVCLTSVFGSIVNGTHVIVASGLCAGTYKVSEPARRIDDGAFCDVYLSKVRT